MRHTIFKGMIGLDIKAIFSAILIIVFSSIMHIKSANIDR